MYSAPGLVTLMQSWVDTGSASIAIQSSSRLHLDASCPTSLDTLRSPDCPFVSPPTIPTTMGRPEPKTTQKKPEETNKPASEDRTGLSASPTDGEIGGMFIGVLVVLLLTVVIMLLAVVLMRKWKPILPRMRWVYAYT